MMEINERIEARVAQLFADAVAHNTDVVAVLRDRTARLSDDYEMVGAGDDVAFVRLVTKSGEKMAPMAVCAVTREMVSLLESFKLYRIPDDRQADMISEITFGMQQCIHNVIGVLAANDRAKRATEPGGMFA